MAYDARVYNVMIASPSDVADERRIAREVILEWDYVNTYTRRIVLIPVAWETHSSPSMEDPPQEVINKQLLRDSDLLVAIFWTRLGSPTEKAPSGTVEEIEEHIKAGKPVMLYFSLAAMPQSIDHDQHKALKAFREQCKVRGLYEAFDSTDDFRHTFPRQLAQTVERNFHVPDTLPTDKGLPSPPKAAHDVSGEARILLMEAASSRDRTVMKFRTQAGLYVQANGKQFVQKGDPRSEATWEEAIEELCAHEMLRQTDAKGQVFSVTGQGYKLADLLREGAA